MPNGVRAEVVLDLLADLTRDLRREVEVLGHEELAWRPDPRANSVGVTVWHVGRWFDLLAHRILQGLDAGEEIWYHDGWAERTGYDPRGIGLRGWGAVTGYTVEEVAAIPPLAADQLLAYVESSAGVLADAIGGLSDESLMKAPPGYSGSRSAHAWIKQVLEGGFGHLGEIRSLRALRGWARSA